GGDRLREADDDPRELGRSDDRAAPAPDVGRKLEEIRDGPLGERAGLPRGGPDDKAEVAGVVDAWQGGRESPVELVEAETGREAMIQGGPQPEGGDGCVTDAHARSGEGVAVGAADGEAACRVDHPGEAGESDIADFVDMETIPGEVDHRRSGHVGWMPRSGR